MFDVARLLALGWCAWRWLQVPRSGARRPVVLVLIVVAGYALLAQVSAGLLRCAGDPLEAAYAALFFAVGPSFLPFAPLPPSVPLGNLVTAAPALVDLALALGAGLVSRRLADHAADLPIARQDEALRWSRLSLALALILVLDLLAALVRLGPALLNH
jgi:hypothetical protein